jgi:5-(carboxyamino)imidazole ribonucleotide mutase
MGNSVKSNRKSAPKRSAKNLALDPSSRQAKGHAQSKRNATSASKASKMGPPQVGIIMGSISDRETMQGAADILASMGIAYEMQVVSAHRTPQKMVDYARGAAGRGLQIIIAGAGGAAHLPGMTASMTTLPVIGVPVKSQALNGLDSLLSIVQMPAGIPVATMAIGNSKNAGLLAARILALQDTRLAEQVAAHMRQMDADVQAMRLD